MEQSVKKTAKKRGNVWITIVTVITALVAFALLELNRNTVYGWVLAALVLIDFYFICRKLLNKHRFWRFPMWLVTVAAIGAILIFTVGDVALHPAVKGENGGVTEVISLTDGEVTGLYTADRAVEVYAGIPYAAPPVGELRWKEPQPCAPWSGVRACDHFAPMSMQPQTAPIVSSLSQIIGYHDYEISLDDNFTEPNSEDALYVNVWKPAGAQEKLPVVVYVHGGSLQTGQPWYADYRGEGLARKGCVAVNMGYRLGVFGCLALDELAEESPNGTTGNYALLDQIAALRWVRENIASFGGDPNNVTLAGESAGSACVSALCTSPLAKGLFRRVIGESSTTTAVHPTHSFRLLDEAKATGCETMARFGVSTLEELRALPAETLVAAADTNHHMTVDGYVLKMTPYESYRRGIHNEEAVLHGFNALEGAPFILFDQANLKTFEGRVRAYFGDDADAVLAHYQPTTDDEAKAMWTDIYSVVFFTYGHYCWTRQAVENKIPVWEYYFSKENGRLGPWHSGEEVYCYGNIPADSKLYDDSDRALAEIFSGYVANFARTGDPNGEGLPVWDEGTSGNELLELGATVAMRDDPFAALYSVMDKRDGFEAQNK